MQFTFASALALLAVVASATPTPVVPSNCNEPANHNGTSTTDTTTPTTPASTPATTPGGGGSSGGGGSKIPADAKFQLLSLRSASPVHLTYFEASQRAFFLHLPDQNATCTGGEDLSKKLATFYLKDGNLFLYGSDANKTQEVFTDLSGMGRGVTGYTTGDEPMPKNAMRGPWSLDENDSLTLQGTGFVACPNSIQGAWVIAVSNTSDAAGNTNCLGITARAVVDPNPPACLYTTQ